MTDAELVEKCQNGNVGSFNTLVWRWQKDVYNFILRYVGDPEIAKEVCQQTFVRVYQKIDKKRLMKDIAQSAIIDISISRFQSLTNYNLICLL